MACLELLINCFLVSSTMVGYSSESSSGNYRIVWMCFSCSLSLIVLYAIKITRYLRHRNRRDHTVGINNAVNHADKTLSVSLHLIYFINVEKFHRSLTTVVMA